MAVEFIDNICAQKSVSFVGMAKNTGKTECLKWVLSACAKRGELIGITTIGLDGESCDQVTGTEKPEIYLTPDMLFVTSEKLYHERKLTSEILSVSRQSTALGRLVTARAITPGKVLLSGPVSTGRIKEVIAELHQYGAAHVFVDGALSRKSLGSPSVTEGLVLATGAAVSPNLSELVRKTKFVCEMIDLERFCSPVETELLDIENGIYALDDDGSIVDLGISSAFLLEQNRDRLFSHGHRLFVSGAISDKILDFLRCQPDIGKTQVIIKDFTKNFATPMAVHAFQQKGGKITVLLRPRLLGVCANPWSPAGYVMDSDRLCSELTQALHVPVMDVRRLEM